MVFFIVLKIKDVEIKLDFCCFIHRTKPLDQNKGSCIEPSDNLRNVVNLVVELKCGALTKKGEI